MAENMEKDSKNYILDTSAIISLESIGILDRLLNLFLISTTGSVIKELEEFAKYDDKYGKIAKKVLKKKNKLKIESCEITVSIKYVEETDNELYNLALKKKLPLISDETKLIHHARDKIDVYFSPVFLILLLEAGLLTKKEALNKLEKLRDIRNWRSNIIYLTSKNELEKV
jgi:rRNA-processing protein FCF1